MNYVNISQNFIQSPNGLVKRMTEFGEVDISGISNIISSLDYKVENQNHKQNYVIDPYKLIRDLSGILIPNKILEKSVITFVQLHPVGNQNYQFEFISSDDSLINLNESVAIEMNCNNAGRPKKSFGAVISEKDGSRFKLESKIIDNSLVSEINSGDYSYQMIKNNDSYLVDYQQLFVLSLITIKNLTNRIQNLENQTNGP